MGVLFGSLVATVWGVWGEWGEWGEWEEWGVGRGGGDEKRGKFLKTFEI